jgi:hypothetical protein
MPHYALVTIITARDAQQAWADLANLIRSSEICAQILYVGAPWLMPTPLSRDTDLATERIQMQVNGECHELSPAE